MTLRPLLPDDIPACQQVSWDALQEQYPMGDLTPDVRARGEKRIAHLQQTDPASAWVAEEDGEVVGHALALVRDGMWFLSLLMVSPEHQGKGLGKALLDATLRTATDRSWILSTTDPAALRRYRRAGFDLVPALTAKGVVDRSLIPAVGPVREGSYDGDGDLVDDVALAVRGAAMTPDLGYLDEIGARLLVDPGRGYAILRKLGVVSMAARDPESAQRLLWAALAETDEGTEVEVDWLAHDQQWAIDVCLDARLPLCAGGGHLCFRGQPPMSPYLPGGALG